MQRNSDYYWQRELFACTFFLPELLYLGIFLKIKWHILHSILEWELLFAWWKVRFREIRDFSQKNIN